MNREPRANQVVRLNQIDGRIRSGEYPNAKTLAAEFDVTERLIFRDRKKLIALGAPIANSKVKGGWYYRDPRWVLPWLRLSEDELVTFFLAVANARANGNSGMEEPLQSLTEKLTGTLGGQDSIDLNAVRDSTSIALPPAMQVKSERYVQLCRARSARLKVKIGYYTAATDQTSERVVHPYDLHITRGETVLISYDEMRKAQRNFNIGRISHLETLTEHFEIPASYNREEYLRTIFFAEAGEVIYGIVVRFDSYQARYIKEREWHPDQQLEFHEDGGLTINFPASGLAELARWVMGYGKHARVLEPPELVSLVQTHIEELVKLYTS